MLREEQSRYDYIGKIDESVLLKLELTAKTTKGGKTSPEIQLYTFRHVTSGAYVSVFTTSESFKTLEVGNVVHVEGNVKYHRIIEGIPRTTLNKCSILTHEPEQEMYSSLI